VYSNIPNPLVICQSFMEFPIFPRGHGVNIWRNVFWPPAGRPRRVPEGNFPAITDPNFGGCRE
jgi:hypothetical protein